MYRASSEQQCFIPRSTGCREFFWAMGSQTREHIVKVHYHREAVHHICLIWWYDEWIFLILIVFWWTNRKYQLFYQCHFFNTSVICVRLPQNWFDIIAAPPPAAAGAPNSQIKHRLDQLDDFEEGSVQEMQNLSIQDWMKKFATTINSKWTNECIWWVYRVEEQGTDLCTAWDNEQRVKSLKIVIQVLLEHLTCYASFQVCSFSAQKCLPTHPWSSFTQVNSCLSQMFWTNSVRWPLHVWYVLSME